tara:strand:- start:172 stop:846 length:675 start_codon:yes stop_codon:yes gene_type:complete
MPQNKSKKILLYFFLFLIIGTLNNKNLNNPNLSKISKINVEGLSEVKNTEVINSLNFLKINNLFFLDKIKVQKTLNSNNLIQKYTVYKKYPSTLNIKIEKTKFLAQIKNDKGSFFLGSNGRLIKTNDLREDIPFIFGNFKIENFLLFKKEIDDSELDFNSIKNLFFFKSGRWDIKTKSGLIIKLPKENIKKSLNLVVNFINQKSEIEMSVIDIRQNNQIIVNGK